MDRLTVGDLISFIQSHEEITKESIVGIIDQDGILNLAHDVSILNTEGVYDWVIEENEVLDVPHGGVVSFLTSGKYKTEEKSIDNKLSWSNLTRRHNVVIQSERPLTLEKIMNKIHFMKKQDNNSVNDDSLLMGWEGKLINSVDSVDNITIFASDNYGHKVTFSPKNPMLLFKSSENIKNEFNPNKMRKNEGVMTFSQFKSKD